MDSSAGRLKLSNVLALQASTKRKKVNNEQSGVSAQRDADRGGAVMSVADFNSFPQRLNAFLVGHSYKEVITGCLAAAAVAATKSGMDQATFQRLTETAWNSQRAGTPGQHETPETPISQHETKEGPKQ